MRIGISFNEDIPFDRQREMAKDVEAAGLSSMWANDALGRDPFLLCQAWAEVTSTLQIGIGIVQMLTRTAVQYAKAAATLQELSGGRFMLGFGVSQPAAMRWHGIEIHRPLSATRDMLEIVRTITQGATTDHDGVLSSHGFRLQISPLPAPVPLYLGAMRPRALALAGTHADGVLLSWEGVDAVGHAADVVRAAATEAGRPEPEIAAYVRVAVAEDANAARAALAHHLAYYWPFYSEHFARQCAENAITAARAAYEQGGPDALVAALDDDILLTLGWYGTPGDDLGAFLKRFEAVGLDHFIVRLVPVGEPLASLATALRTISRYAAPASTVS